MANLFYHCFNAIDFYKEYDTRRLKFKKADAKKAGAETKKHYCVSVFLYCLYLIFLDIIENNITFVLPLFSNRDAFFFIKPITGDDLKYLLQHGCMKQLDIIKSNFTGYVPIFQFKTSDGRIKEKTIYLNKTLRDKLYEHINSGKQYY